MRRCPLSADESSRPQSILKEFVLELHITPIEHFRTPFVVGAT